MAPLAKTKHSDHILYSNIIPLKQPVDKDGKPVSSNEETQSGGTSYQQAMAITYQMLMAIAIDMGVIGKGFNQIQSDQATVSKSQADTTSESTKKYLQQVYDASHESFWSKFADAFKWIGLAVAAIVGALLCETPAGFAMLALVIGLTASGLLNKGLALLGGAIGDLIGNKTAGNIIAQVLGIVVITVATCGAESAFSIAMATRAATQAADTAATQIAVKVGEEVAEEVVATTSETVVQNASSLTETASDAATSAQKSFGDYFKASLKGYSTRTVFVNTLCSSNLIGELVQQMIEHIPGNSAAKQIAESILTAVATIAVAIASFQGMSGNASFMSRFTDMVPKLRTGIFAFQGATSVIGDTATAGNSWENYLSAEIQKGEAPLKAEMDRSQGIAQVFNSLSKETQQVMEAMIKSFQPLFSINFGAGWQAAAQGLA